MPDASKPDEWLSSTDAEKYIGKARGYLAKLRVHGGGPPYTKIGTAANAHVHYFREDLDDWIESRRFTNTSQYPTRRD